VTTDPAGPEDRSEPTRGALAVLRNRSFLLLWLSQAATQIGGNMVLYGLTVIVLETTASNAAVSGLILTFLVPAVLLSALAGVYVDRFDARSVLWVTNLLRGIAIAAMVLVHDQLGLIYVLNILVSTVTTFFSPAEAAMIPRIVPRAQLVAANGIFTITLNAAFALGFALLGSLAVSLAGPTGLLLIVAVLYLVASGFCFTLPRSALRPGGMRPGQVVTDAERAVSSTFGQLREGLSYIRANPSIAWSIVYLGATASLVGVLGVLGPGFATRILGLEAKDFIVIVLPLGLGVVVGILVLNYVRALVARQRLIELGLVVLGGLIAALAVVGQLTRIIARVAASTAVSLSSIVSVLSIVIVVALLAGMAYAAVAISAQTQLQEELPEDVRGRVYGVLFSLISVASFVPVIVVGPIADLVGTTTVLLGVAASVAAVGLASIVTRRRPREAPHLGPPAPVEPFVLTPDSAARHSDRNATERRSGRGSQLDD